MPRAKRYIDRRYGYLSGNILIMNFYLFPSIAASFPKSYHFIRRTCTSYPYFVFLTLGSRRELKCYRYLTAIVFISNRRENGRVVKITISIRKFYEVFVISVRERRFPRDIYPKAIKITFRASIYRKTQLSLLKRALGLSV